MWLSTSMAGAMRDALEQISLELMEQANAFEAMWAIAREDC